MFQKNHFQYGNEVYSLEKFKKEQYSIITIYTQSADILFG
jgi:hypothetical protein